MRVSPVSLFLAKRLPEENQRFYPFFAYGITETLAICSICFRIHRVGQIVVFFYQGRLVEVWPVEINLSKSENDRLVD